MDHRNNPRFSECDHWIDRYLSFLTVEKGLSANTLESYSRDLQGFMAYLADQDVLRLEDIQTTAILGYLFKR